MAVRRPAIKARAVLMNAAVAALTLIVMTPLAWMVTVSFMPRGESSRFPPPFWPSRWSLENYHELLVRRRIDGAWFDYRIVPALWNSIGVALLATALGLLLTVPAFWSGLPMILGSALPTSAKSRRFVGAVLLGFLPAAVIGALAVMGYLVVYVGDQFLA